VTNQVPCFVDFRSVLKTRPRTVRRFFLAALGGDVCVRKLNNIEKDLLDRSNTIEDGVEHASFRSRLLCTILCTSDGSPLFDIGNPDDVSLLDSLESDITDEIFSQWRKIDKPEDAAAIEAAEKNS